MGRVRPSSRMSRTASESATRSRRSEEHTSELQSRLHLVCRLLLEKKKNRRTNSNGRYLVSTVPYWHAVAQVRSVKKRPDNPCSSYSPLLRRDSVHPANQHSIKRLD